MNDHVDARTKPEDNAEYSQVCGQRAGDQGKMKADFKALGY